MNPTLYRPPELRTTAAETGSTPVAMQSFTPHSVPSDLMHLQEIHDLLQQTGHPVSVSTIRRWVTARDLYSERRRSRQGWRRDYVSFSDILVAHRDWVAGQA